MRVPPHRCAGYVGSACLRYARELGWAPRLAAIEDIVATAWRWRRRHEHGYAADQDL